MAKRCSRKDCEQAGVWQPSENFGKCNHTKDGLYPDCRKCRERIRKKSQDRKRDDRKEFYETFIGYTL